MSQPRTGAGDRRSGILLAAVAAAISGVAVFVNGYGVRAWGEIADPTAYTTLKNAVAASVLVAAAVVAHRKAGIGLAPLGEHRLGLGVIAVVGGSVPFLLFFEGLARATSVDAAFIHKTLVVWVAVLAVTVLQERIGPLHVAAIALLIGGQAMLAGVGGIAFGPGEWMILGATVLWAVETVVAKRVLGGVAPLSVGVARMVGGAVVLLVYCLVTGAFSGLGGATPMHMAWILVTGVTLAGYVGTWFAALARAQAVDVSAVLVGGALVTALLESGIGGAVPPPVLGVALVAFGVSLMVVRGLVPATTPVR
jgi:drug/metabolite transporter (DMT)-like permease